MNPADIPAWGPFLRKLPVFEGLDAEEIEQIALRLTTLLLPREAVLFKKDEEADAFYIIASGQVRVVDETPSGERVVSRLGYGEVVGEGALLIGEPRTATIKLDTSCEFLKLSREDFQIVLRKSPQIAVHLSQVITKRLMAASRPVSTQKRKSEFPRLVTLSCALSPVERVFLGVHLAFQMLEQTHRRVLLVDMDGGKGGVAEALGLKGGVIEPGSIQGIDLHQPVQVRSLASMHPSGLSVMSVPPESLAGLLEGSLFLFLNSLREAYDLVLVVLDGRVGPVERAVLDESDRIFLAASRGNLPLFRLLESDLRTRGGKERFAEIFLGEVDWKEDSPDAPFFKQRIPCTDAVLAKFQQSKNVFESLKDCPKTEAGIARLARRIGGLKVGLAMSAGAALGYALIGVLKVFKKEGIPVDIVAGTSMGALLGGFFAAGLEPEEIEDIALKVDKAWIYKNLAVDMSWPRSGFFSGGSLLAFIREHVGAKKFADLDIPFAATACDIDSGEEVTLRSGPVAEAVRASCGLPMVFSPMWLEGRYLVDGGLVNPVPTSVLSTMGADILLAVNLTVAPARKRVSLSAGGKGEPRLLERGLSKALGSPGIFRVFFHMIYTMEYEIAQKHAALAHVMIKPELGGFSWADLDKAARIIELGERAAEEHAPRIKALLPFFADSCRMPLRLSSKIS